MQAAAEIVPADEHLAALGSEFVPCELCGEPGCEACLAQGRMTGGVEFLLIQPHFSEAVAFATGVQTPTSLVTQGVALDFEYDASFRASLGYWLEGGCGGLRFTYTNLQGEVDVNGSVSAPGQFIVDPFGNLVGEVTIIDPSDARVGMMLVGGDRIATHAAVELNVFDLEFASSAVMMNPAWALEWSAGVRVADVSQFYQSVVTNNAGTFLSGGDFAVEFTGGGPRLGLELSRCGSCLTVFASGQASLLLGDYDVGFSASPVPVFVGGQSESMTRLVPVLEAEVGASWTPTPRLTVFTGWLFQAWLDFGTSGGTFGNLFTGADDANIMSFDGLLVRAEFSY